MIQKSYKILREHRRYKKELATFFGHHKLTHFVTFVFNRTMLLHVARRKFGEFLARLDRRLLGPSWLKKKDKRVFAIAFPEHIVYNTHYHALFRIAPEYTEKFTAIADQLWRDLVSYGNLCIDEIWNIDHLTTYITKKALREPVLENMVISTEFHPKVAD